jgi:hypothetical protein
MTPTEQQETGTCIRMQEAPQVRVPTKFDEWRAEGEELARRKKGLIAGFWQLQFDVGDWLIDCENYGMGEEITGYSKSTLRTFVYVARHVPFHIRNASLAWGIHQLVAPFKSDDDKELFLQNASTGKWSVSIARTRLIKAQANGLFKSSVEPKNPRDYATQNHGDYHRDLERSQGRKETTQDEIDVAISEDRLRRTLDEMRRWKVHPVDDDDLTRALPLLPSGDKDKVIKRLRWAAQELTKMAERLEVFAPGNQAKAAEIG